MSRDLTGFITYEGLGLASAPAAFQRMMSEILKDCEGVEWYIDDILVHAPNVAQHDRNLRMVLKKIAERGMTLNDKCVFRVSSIEFLGHILDERGVRPSESNTKAIDELQTPRNITQLRSALGMAGFYLRCVSGYATIVEPLRNLLRDGVPFIWTDKEERAFQKLKETISSAIPLAIFDPEKKTIVATDASDYGIGGVLLQ